jgi:hypothetical protein
LTVDDNESPVHRRLRHGRHDDERCQPAPAAAAPAAAADADASTVNAARHE